MTYQANYTLPGEMMEQIAEGGLDALPELIRILINTAMQAERDQHVQAAPYERTSQRRGHANGFKPKTLKTRVGEITFAVPQVREGDFYPTALEKGLRSERALKTTLAEMYVQGVSTRKVAAVVKKLCGVEVSSTLVSRATAQLDPILTQWRTRRLGVCPYVILDARYEQVRQDGTTSDAAVLIAIGVGEDGKRRILGVSVAVGEHEVHWRAFLQSLAERGLSGVRLITSDAHPGLGAARQAVFGGVPWQRCQFHLQQNAQAYVLRQEMRVEVARAIRAIFNAPSRADAEALLAKMVATYAKTAPKLATWLEENISQGLSVFALPTAHQRLLRTSNGLERVNREIRRRTRVVGIFPNEAACLRLVSAVLMEISDEWEVGKAYLTFIAT